MRRHEPRTARALWAIAATLAAASAWAHEPVAKCHWLGDTAVRCRGASNEGDPMPGARMEVIALDGQTLLAGTLDARSTLSFQKPAGPFYVLFDTGPGLQVTIEQDEITTPPPGRAPHWMRQP